MRQNLTNEEAEAVLYLSSVETTNWSQLMNYMQRQLEVSQEELERATDMHAAARHQGDCRAYRKILNVAANAQTKLDKSRT